MKIITFLSIITCQLCLAHKDSYVKAKSINQKRKATPFRPFIAVGPATTADFYSHQLGNAFRFVIVSNKWIQIVNEFSNYSRMNYADKKKNINEREISVSVNCGYSNKKPFYTYGIAGLAHRKVIANEANLQSNKCNTFSLGAGGQINFKHLSPFIESRMIKQDYSSDFVGLFNPGIWHPLLIIGINVHPTQEVENYSRNKRRKRSKVFYHKQSLQKQLNKTIVNCTYF